MPKRKDVRTLKNICMRCVSKNLSNYLTEELQCLPWDLCQDLIQFIHDLNLSRQIQRRYRHHEKSYIRINPSDVNRLIGANVRKLTISFSNDCEPLCNDTFSAVLRTCKSLTHFTCESVGTLTRQDFHKFVLNIPNIVFLRINSHNFPSPYLLNDDFLEVVGNNCFKLESLDLVAEITDYGIRRLCQSFSQGRNIKYLGMYGNKLTEAGCLTALLNLKKLKILDHCKVVKALFKLFQQSNGSQPPKFNTCKLLDYLSFHQLIDVFRMLFHQKLPTFQLCKLPSISTDYYPKGFLSFVTKICPNLTILDLSVSEVLTSHIDELKTCDRTLKLHITYHFSLSDLAQVASKLTCLSLSGTNVDLERIGFTCLNLTKLTLADVSCQPLTYVKTDSTSFSKLQKLDISANTSLISISHLKLLLRNCLDLEKLKISSYNEITDDVMISVIREVNPLKNLTRFVIRSCRNISKVTLMMMLIMENNLQLIEMTGHLGIPYDDIVVIKSYIKENNWLVQLDFSPFPYD